MRYLIAIGLLIGCATPRYETDEETGVRYYHTNKRFYSEYTGCPEAKDIYKKDTLKQDKP